MVAPIIKSRGCEQKKISVALSTSTVKILNEYKAIINAEESLENPQ